MFFSYELLIDDFEIRQIIIIINNLKVSSGMKPFHLMIHNAISIFPIIQMTTVWCCCWLLKTYWFWISTSERSLYYCPGHRMQCIFSLSNINSAIRENGISQFNTWRMLICKFWLGVIIHLMLKCINLVWYILSCMAKGERSGHEMKRNPIWNIFIYSLKHCVFRIFFIHL